MGWLAIAPFSGTTLAVLTTTLVITSPVVSSPQTVPTTLLVAEEVYDIYLPVVLRQ